MMGFIGRGHGYVLVVTAQDKVQASRLMIQLLREGGKTDPDLEVQEFDPSLEGGMLIDNLPPTGRDTITLN